MKKVFRIFAIVCVCLVVSGCVGEKEKEKNFSGNGFSITLTENFQEKEIISVTNYYQSINAIVTALKEEFTLLEAVGINKDSTIEEYANVIAYNNQKDYDFKKNTDLDYLYFTYEATVSGKDYYYYAVIKKGSDSFWLINFACLKGDADDFQPKFEKWASTIKVD